MTSTVKLPFRLEGMTPVADSWAPYANNKKSAVCMLLSQCDGETRIILTKRTITVGSHKGQISFPGGMADITDKSPADAATREVHEELGLPKDQIQILGSLPLTTALGSFPVFSIVAATVVSPTQMLKQDSEVDEIIAVPWQLLATPKLEFFKFNMYGVWVESPLYKIAHHRVWGLTAKIIQSAIITEL
jgi:8-oxo-dGTP pyrophosphatase MutT (NUDIX family)